MKKFIALALSIALIATLGVIAFAENPIGGAQGTVADSFSGGSDSQNITLNINNTGTIHKYRIDLTWSATTLDVDAAREWNVEDLKYEYTFQGDAKEVSVEVKNRSDMPVNAELTGVAASEYTSFLTVSCDDASDIGDAISGTAPTVTYKATITPSTDAGSFASEGASVTLTDAVTLTMTIKKAA